MLVRNQARLFVHVHRNITHNLDSLLRGMCSTATTSSPSHSPKVKRLNFNPEEVLQRAYELADMPDVALAKRVEQATDLTMGTVIDIGNENITVKGLGVAPIGATVVFETKKGKAKGLVTKIGSSCAQQHYDNMSTRSKEKNLQQKQKNNATNQKQNKK